MKVTLSSKQKAAIEAGKVKRNRLIRACEKASDAIGLPLKQKHWYIYGPAGIGKTYNAIKALESTGVIYREVSGNISLYYLGIELAVIKYLYPTEKVVVVIDDCDEILKDAKSINIFKKILGGDKGTGAKFSYQQRINMGSLGDPGDLMYDAVESMRKGVGYEVLLDNFTFIITSNMKLPYDDTVNALKRKVATENGVQLLDTTASVKAGHLAPIRSRCQTKDFDLTKEEKWGLIADVTLEENVCDHCDDQQTMFILNYLWNNWDNMTENSIRTVEKMADIFAYEGEEDIIDAFDADFLK